MAAFVGQKNVVFFGSARVSVCFEMDGFALLRHAIGDTLQVGLRLGAEAWAVEIEVDRLQTARIGAAGGLTTENALATVADFVHRTVVVGLALAICTVGFAATAVHVASLTAAALAIGDAAGTGAVAANESGIAGIDRLARRTDITGAGGRSCWFGAAIVDAGPVFTVGAFGGTLGVFDTVLANLVDTFFTEFFVAVFISATCRVFWLARR